MSPATIDRLKSLPLTIVLTVLIWMYAEAKFTATGDARISLQPSASDANVALRVFDPTENRYLPAITIVASVQGPTNQITAMQQETEPPRLTFPPPASSLVPGERIDTVAVLNTLSYFRKHGMTVTSATPSKLLLEVDHLETLTRPIEFRPTVAVDHVTNLPDQATVTIPSRTLQEIGGAGKITVAAVPARSLSTLPVGQTQNVMMRFVPEYSGQRDDRITVSPAQVTVALMVSKREVVTQKVDEVPVWVSGPPALLARFDVDLKPKFVTVTVAGSDVAIRALRDKLSNSLRGTGGGDQGVHAYVDVSLADRPSDTYTKRALRYVLPDGLSVQDAPGQVEFRLVELATQAGGTQGGGSTTRP